METVSENINKIYKKIGYFERYGGSLFVTVIIAILTIIFIAYFSVHNRIKEIRKNWLVERCNPNVIPFAGMINKPDNVSAFEFTGANFMGCTNQILEEITGYFVQPIYYLMSNVTKVFSELAHVLQSIREFFNYLRSQLLGTFANVFTRIYSTMIPIQHMTIKIKDVMAKAQGVMAAAIFTLLNLYLAIKSFIGSVVEILIIVLVVMAAAIVIMWILPFTWPAAAVATGVFIAVMIPLIIITVWTKKILHISSSNLPSKQGRKRCFDGDTLLTLSDGTTKIIKDIKTGDVLSDGGRVTAVFKLASCGMTMYNFDDVIVSGCHRVLYNNAWKIIQDIDESEEVEYWKEEIYCLTTTTKRIPINNFLYLDWDELDEISMVTFKSNARSYLSKEIDYENIHETFDGGFHEDTKLELVDGGIKSIKDITINDILRLDGRILGKIEIDATDLENIKDYSILGKQICGGPNLFIVDNDLGNFSTLDMVGKKISPQLKLYHLITETNQLTVDNIKFSDYDGNIDIILGTENTE